ncbi:hypothetical protein [Actinophytocola sp.]|uniref:hypothetical protein n=1 Tax=Actinophytocola sp. TaxID=1872138 RepID=UPI003D6B43BF
MAFEGFTPKVPRIAVVAPKRFHGAVEGLMSSFRNGVRGAKAFSQGFVRKYRLTDCTLRFTTFDGDVCDWQCQPVPGGQVDLHAPGRVCTGVPGRNIHRDDIAHPLNTMALACYAKLGGTPCVVSVPRRRVMDAISVH